MADDKPQAPKVEDEKAPAEVEASEVDEPEVDAGDVEEAAAEDAEPPIEPTAEPEAEAPESPEAQDVTPAALAAARASEVAFSWEASEYVHNHKGPGWYAALFGILAVLVVGAALLHLWLEIGLFVVMGGAVVVYARKPPRTLLYELTSKGITIDGKEVPFAELRSFGVLKEAEWHTIDLDPTKRFSPRLSILFDSDDFENVVGHLELHLPRADRDPDMIERATRYLRF